MYHGDVKKIQLLLDIIANKSAVSIQVTLPFSTNEIDQLRHKLMDIGSGMDTLRDIDKTSMRTPMLLSLFIAELQQLTTSSNEEARSTAYRMLLRYAQFAPRDCDTIIDGYIDHLSRSDVNSGDTSTLENAVEFFHYCQGP